MAKTCINYFSNIVQNLLTLTDKISHGSNSKDFGFNFVDPLDVTISKYVNDSNTLLLSEVIYQSKMINSSVLNTYS